MLRRLKPIAIILAGGAFLVSTTACSMFRDGPGHSEDAPGQNKVQVTPNKVQVK